MLTISYFIRQRLSSCIMSQRYYPPNNKQSINQGKINEEKVSSTFNPDHNNNNNIMYSKQRSSKLGIEVNDEEEKACPPKSPLKWICDFGAEKKLASKLSFFNMSKTSSNNSNPPDNTNINYNGYSNLHYDARLEYETRKKAADNFLQHIDSDEEMHPPNNISGQNISNEIQDTIPISMMNTHMLQNPTSKQSSNANLTNLTGDTPPSYIMISNPSENKIRPIQGEARIVAPNVSKLSPNSAVEIRLQSNKESVTVLCSVDVLKMRSGFFHDILSDQEKNYVKSIDPAQIQAHNKAMLNLNLSNSFTSTVSTPNNMLNSQNYSSNILWRDPIIIPEATPFDAAAFLESLHEGRALFRGEWNYCWARLSVSWIIEDLILEYANQIEEHMNKIVSTIQNNNWRTNPNVLAGMRVCLFRKGSNSLPTIITGSILESSINIGYSRIRVNFDVERMNNQKNGSISVTLANLSCLSPSKLSSILPYPSLSSPNTTITSIHNTNESPKENPISESLPQQQQQYIGDVTEPFWVQNVHKEGSMWCDPDEIFTFEARKYITTTDKRIFWEMARALIELPEISLACKTGIRNIQDLTYALKKPEYRMLWTSEAPEMLPKEMATDLIRAAYLSSFDKPIL